MGSDMKGMGKIIIGLVAFVLIALGILIPGLYRKHAAKRERQETASRADEICRVTVRDFLQEGREQRTKLLKDAKRHQIAIETDSGAQQSKAEDLSDWLASRRKVQEELDKHESKLRTLLDGLAFDFPADSSEQLPPKKATELRSVVAEAKKAASGFPAEIGGEKVDFKHGLRATLTDFTARSNTVSRQLTAREQAYKDFAERIKLKVKNPAEVNEKTVVELEGWIQRASPDEAKKKALLSYYRPLVSAASTVKGPEDKAAVLAARLRGIISALKEETEDVRRRLALEQCKKVMKEAEQAGVAKSIIEEAQREMAPVKADLAAKAKGGRKHKLAADIIGKTQEFSKAKDNKAKEKIKKEAGDLLAKLKVQDKEYAKFFELACRELFGPPPKPPVKPKPILKYVGPEWETLDPTRKELAAIAKTCRDLMAKTKERITRSRYNEIATKIETYLKGLDAIIEATDQEVARANSAKSNK